ncbi:MAG: hypothetical protein Q8P18_15720 [Pseudomonadota bacterium]|nr:hypothetical protein [Pseudomonadota bacterium]
MNLYRPLLLALVLGAPGVALAGNVVDHVYGSFYQQPTGCSFRAVIPESDTAIASVTVRVRSDAGDEDATLVESDAWLHGAATIAALPATDAALTLTVYDAANTSLISFSGTLGADGTVTLTADAGEATDTSGCTSRLGCTVEATADIELLAADPAYYVSHAADHDSRVLAFDLSGADTYAIAYAEIVVTESVDTDTSEECLRDRTGDLCVLSGIVRSRAEVYWNDIGSVWEAELALEHEGVVEVKVKTRGADGETIETTKSKLGAPWIDGGEGVNTLATDEDPLTTVALGKGLVGRWDFDDAAGQDLTVVSEGWTLGEAIPTHAEVELTDGETITIPVNSYQRRARAWMVNNYEVQPVFGLSSDRRYRTYLGLARNGSPEARMEPDAPQCSDGFCMVVSELADGGYELSATVYGGDASALPDETELTATLYDEFGEALVSESFTIEFEDEVSAVFSNEVHFTQDPVGLDVSGRVKLLGEADRRGRQDTLAKGRFYGSFSRDGDGDVGLAGIDKDRVSAWDTAFIAGETNALEVSGDDDGNGVIEGPPVVQFSVFGSQGIAVPRCTTYQLSVQ